MDWKRVVTEQATPIEKLRAEIVEIKAEIAILKKNSATSSKPLSSDIVKPPNRKKPDYAGLGT